MRTFLDGKVHLHAGDCLDVIRTLPDASVDSCVTDPPYALVSIAKRFGKDGAAPCKVPENGTGAYARASAGFMGKRWDTGEVAFSVEFWSEVLRVLKPGGHVLAFGGTRTYHRLACAIEDAGFEIRDQIGWAFGSGFPKSHDVAVAIDKANGIGPRAKAFNMKGRGDRAEEMDSNGREYLPPYRAITEDARRWQGWGTALKPAWESICVARKPLIGTVAANVLEHGTGAMNIDGCRVEAEGVDLGRNNNARTSGTSYVVQRKAARIGNSRGLGRWPANLIHDGSDEVIAAFPESEARGGNAREKRGTKGVCFGHGLERGGDRVVLNDSGSAGRFFYSAKADADDRLGSRHPTVKPVDLMQWLVRLVTPPGGVVLDPFSGTGTTGEAAFREGFDAILIEREAEYLSDIERRMQLALGGPDERRHAIIKAKGKVEEAGPLFAEVGP